MEDVYFLTCPLCQLDVNIEQQDTFLILPLNSYHGQLFSQKDWNIDEFHVITIRDLRLQNARIFPSFEYTSRVFLIHQRCYELVEGLSHSQLYTLIDLVEPTFDIFPWDLLHTSSTHGAFCSPSPILLPRVGSNAEYFNSSSENNTRKEKGCVKRTLGQLVDRLPFEIQENIFKYDIGRLLFIMRAASQLSIKNEVLVTIPENRFSETRLTVHGNMVQIHLVDIGGRIYIGDIISPENATNPYRISKHLIAGCLTAVLLNWMLYVSMRQWMPGYISLSVVATFGFMLCSLAGLAAQDEMTEALTQRYQLGESKYLAVKSDEVGVIDIAFEEIPADYKIYEYFEM
ncbi:hypothetical protein PRK78_006964 [Emydomyces testavorans]|uniref:Uncharacterized protein n=1 Tax=Emydomyces testavorans TaxID=2070801 RepID=A0AAF0DNE1_9EURO|nr:hypothetical protein PRK78_006964 [Emydomyces testavorans]